MAQGLIKHMQDAAIDIQEQSGHSLTDDTYPHPIPDLRITPFV
jgi:hypothetical protein